MPLAEWNTERLSVSSDTESERPRWFSYEENQFKWAKEELNGGNTDRFQEEMGIS